MKIKRVALNNSGFASMVIALMLIIVIALMSVGFAQLARREQQTALNNQLSSQAYYAAESGINDAFYDLTNTKTGGGAPCAAYPAGTEPYINSCNADNHNCMDTSTLSQSAKSYNSVIDASSDIAITCLLVDLTPPDLAYSNIGEFSSRYIIFNTDNSLGTLNFTWQSADEKNPGSSSMNSKFPTTTSEGFLPRDLWKQKNYPGVIQVNFTPIGSTFNRTDLLNNTISIFLYPSTNIGGFIDQDAIDYQQYKSGPQNNPTVLSGHCTLNPTNFNYQCNSRILVAHSPGAGTGPFLVSFTDYYDASDLKIRACKASNTDFGTCFINEGNSTGEPGSVLNFINGQAVVDVTARARNVVKRIQDYIPIKQQYNLPQFALEAQDICKQFATGPPPFVTRFNTALPGCNFN